MRAAWREWRYAEAKGWTIGPDAVTFAGCLRIAHGVQRAAWQRAVFAAQAALLRGAA